MSMSSARAGQRARSSDAANAAKRNLDKGLDEVMSLSRGGSWAGIGGVGGERSHRDPLVDCRGRIRARIGDDSAQVPFAVGAQRVAGGARGSNRLDSRV